VLLFSPCRVPCRIQQLCIFTTDGQVKLYMIHIFMHTCEGSIETHSHFPPFEKADRVRSSMIQRLASAV
jgi:hypothetical protein